MTPDTQKSKASGNGGFYFQPKLIEADSIIKVSSLSEAHWIQHICNIIVVDIHEDKAVSGAILIAFVRFIYPLLLSPSRNQLLKLMRHMYNYLYMNNGANE